MGEVLIYWLKGKERSLGPKQEDTQHHVGWGKGDVENFWESEEG